MIKFKKKYLLLWYSLLTFTNAAFASGSFGDIAKNIGTPLQGVAGIVQAVCVVAGVGLIVGAIIRYMQYRKNPVEATLGGCIALFCAGLALIALTFIPVPTIR